MTEPGDLPHPCFPASWRSVSGRVGVSPFLSRGPEAGLPGLARRSERPRCESWVRICNHFSELSVSSYPVPGASDSGSPPPGARPPRCCPGAFGARSTVPRAGVRRSRDRTGLEKRWVRGARRRPQYRVAVTAVAPGPGTQQRLMIE